MDSSVLKGRMKEALELKTGEAFEIAYHGGSQPGKKRLLLPLKVNDDSVFAKCYNSNATKSFIFKNMEFVSVLEADNILSWQPEDYRCAKEILSDFSSEMLDELRPKVWTKGYLIGGEEKTKLNQVGSPESTGTYELKVVGHRNSKGIRTTYLTLTNEKGVNSHKSWKLKIKNTKAEVINSFQVAIDTFLYEINRLPDISYSRQIVEYYHPAKDPLTNLRSLWNQNSEKSKAQRTSELIVGTILKQSKTSFKFAYKWAFDVKYAFREGLGLRYETRTSGALKPYLFTSEKDPLCKSHSFSMWTQIPILFFKQGDSFLSCVDASLSIQVQYSDTMGWDPTQERLHEGLVHFNIYQHVKNTGTHLESKRVCSQYEFLNILVYGDYLRAKILEEHPKAESI